MFVTLCRRRRFKNLLKLKMKTKMKVKTRRELRRKGGSCCQREG